MHQRLARFHAAAPHLNAHLPTRARIVVLAALLCGVSGVPAQIPLRTDNSAPVSGVTPPAFDVVSVKENRSGTPMIRIGITANGFRAENIPLNLLITQAYGIRLDLISGLPDWTGTVRFDVNAKVADEDVPTLKKLTQSQRSAMLIAVLEDRFKAQIRKEVRTLPTYDLVLDKGGMKPALSPAVTTPAGGTDSSADKKPTDRFTVGSGHISATNQPLQLLTSQLAYAVHRTVTDKTGLTGRYNIELKWTPEQMSAAPTDNGADDQAGSIFTALREQLGLKLVSSKGPVDTLVVDHLEKPSEN